MNINRYPQDWQTDLHRQMEYLQHQFPQARTYALIEGALNESCYPLLKRAGCLAYRALFSGTPNADEETLGLSPLLAEYEPAQQRAWDALLQKTDGWSALSLIVTPESLSQLAERLAPWCIVDAAGHPLALSFADTRILPELVKILTLQQSEQFCGPALYWQYVTREAKWEALPLPGSAKQPSDAVTLDERQCASLIAAAEADHVLYQLKTSGSSLVDRHAPAPAHALVRYWLSCADHAQIESVPARVELCEMGLTHSGLENHPRIATWLAAPSKARSIASLREELLPDALA
jgi:hypothetical protein